MSRKILIWDLNINLKNAGGPAGYLFNIREYLRQNEYECNILFLKDLLGIKNVDSSFHSRFPRLMKWIDKYDILSIKSLYLVLRKALLWGRERKFSYDINLNDFDIIHFHKSESIVQYQSILKDYSGLIVLTTHSPEPISSEESRIGGDKYKFLSNLICKRILEKEMKAWSIADYLMFPVKEALEPYMKCGEMREYYLSNKNKFVYCATSILDRSIPLSLKFERKNYNIPEDALLIVFVGRHSIIKGYDQLQKLALEIFKKRKDVYFVIAGLETPIKRIEHQQWIELGWINYADELINKADLFVLPNKETYFDIVALEVLRAGTLLMLSNTGGNRFLKTLCKENLSGLFFYEYGDIEKQIQIINYIIDCKHNGSINKLSMSNRCLYDSYFSMKDFIIRYTNLMYSLK